MRSWREIRVMMKWKFAVLNDSDFAFNEDNKEKVLDNLAAKIKKTRTELEVILEELQKH